MRVYVCVSDVYLSVCHTQVLHNTAQKGSSCSSAACSVEAKHSSKQNVLELPHPVLFYSSVFLFLPLSFFSPLMDVSISPGPLRAFMKKHYTCIRFHSSAVSSRFLSSFLQCFGVFKCTAYVRTPQLATCGARHVSSGSEDGLD